MTRASPSLLLEGPGWSLLHEHAVPTTSKTRALREPGHCRGFYPYQAYASPPLIQNGVPAERTKVRVTALAESPCYEDQRGAGSRCTKSVTQRLQVWIMDVLGKTNWNIPPSSEHGAEQDLGVLNVGKVRPLINDPGRGLIPKTEDHKVP